MAGGRNVLLIVVDQWRGDCLGALGHPAMRTPNLDRLCRRAVTFRRHYAQAAPCAPARTSLLTGLYMLNHRVVQNGVPLDARHTNLALELRRGGHEPALIGYTTFTPDPRVVPAGDPRFRTIGDVMDGWTVFAHFDETRFRNYLGWVEGQGFALPAGDPTDIWLPESGPPGPTRSASRIPQPLSDAAWTTARGLDFLRAAGRDPWVLHLGHFRPHPPFVAPAPYHDAIPDDAIPPPLRAANPAIEAAQHPMLRHYLDRQSRGTFFQGAAGRVADLTDTEIRLTRKAYYGLIAGLDHELGRVLGCLAETGQDRDTLILFTSDHGEQLGDHHLLGKLGYFDQSYHVPLIVFDPRPEADATRGIMVDAFSESVDVMPTVLDWLGLAVPRTCDGRSLLPFLHGRPPADWRTEVHYEFDMRGGYPDPERLAPDLAFDNGGLAVIQDRAWKYVHFEALPPLLFDLARDPHQFANLAEEPGHQAVVAEYAQKMLSWRMRHAERTLTHLSASPAGLVDRRTLAAAPAGSSRRL